MGVRTLSSAVVLAVFLLPFAAGADEASVPPRLQASLIAKIAPFDRSFLARAGALVVLLVAVRRDDAGSQQVAAEVVEALRTEGGIAGLPLRVDTVEVSEASQLIRDFRSRRPAILYLSTALADEAAALAAGLSGEDVLTLTAESAAVKDGICVGFELVSGKPRILVHLQQSKKQHVNFQATLLHLAKMVDQ